MQLQRILAACLVGLLSVTATTVYAQTAAVDAPRPNVIIVLADDQGYGDLGVHGNPVLKTPNMDRLHAESVRFTDFHVAPMCSPTRGQLLTGVDAMRNGCTAVCQGRSMIRADIKTMADFFVSAGYATGHFGKWHLGDSYPYRPQDRGFQTTIHHRAWGITSLADHWENHTNAYFDPILVDNGTERRFLGYCTDVFFNEAMKWMETQKADQQPFLCYIPTNTPHKPEICDAQYSDPYTGKNEGRELPAQFYGMIANLDENLGRLEAFLEKTGLRDDTILIFLSDNGTQNSQAQLIFNASMRGKKTALYEGGHRVPLFIRWPNGGLIHGQDRHELTQVQDILPTLIDLCGLDKEQSLSFNGTSLAGLVKDPQAQLPDRKLVIQYRASGEPWNSAAVMWDKWRLIKSANEDLFELYHVGNDPSQINNVADVNPEVVLQMKQFYEDWYAEAKPLFDLPRLIVLGDESMDETTLYAQDWSGSFCDNPRHLAAGTGIGFWSISVKQEGVYEIGLRRWPKESGKTLAEAWDASQPKSSLPIRLARLSIAGSEYEVEVDRSDFEATFYVRLSEGVSRLETMFKDDEHNNLCSSFYVYVRRVDNAEASGIHLSMPLQPD